MAYGTFVAYYRVSTVQQGRSGLGLEAQREAVSTYLNGGSWKLASEFTEVESGKDNARPQLIKAMAECRMRHATLVIAKLDRLSRNAHFLLGLQEGGVDFVCADMPEANRMTIGIMAIVAQHEREQISARTKAALKARKARGLSIGTPSNLTDAHRRRGAPLGAAVQLAKADARAADLGATIRELQAAGIASLGRLAVALNERQIPTPRGGLWAAAQVRNLLRRIGENTNA